MRAIAGRFWHSPTATTWGSLLVRLAAMVVVLPLVLVRFAPADVALWQLFSSLFLLAMMLDFGLAPTLARMLAFARGGATLADMANKQQRASNSPTGENTAVLQALMSTLRWLYPRIAVVAVLALALVGSLSLVRPISQAANQTDAWLAWGIVLATTGIALWGGLYSATLQGMDRIAVLRRWEVATGLAQIVSSSLVLLMDGGLLALVAANQSWVVVGALRNRWLVRGAFPALAVAPKRQPDVLRVLWGPTWRSGLGVVMSHGLIQASGVIYSQLAPAAEVAAYLLALRLAMVISQFCQAPFYSKLPRLAELQAAGRRPEQLRLAQRGMRFAYWVFVVGALSVALFIQPALELLGSRTAFVAPSVWAVLSLAFFAERFGAMHLQLYSLTNHIIWHIANGITGVAMIGFGTLLYSRMGALAFPLAMLFAYGGIYCVISVVHTRSAFELRLWHFERGTVLPAALALVAGLGLVLRIQHSF